MMKSDISYIVHEGDMARMDRIIKRLWIVIILLIVLLVGSNACWIWYESQFEQVEETEQYVEQSADADEGDATITDGVHINGKDKADSTD